MTLLTATHSGPSRGTLVTTFGICLMADAAFIAISMTAHQWFDNDSAWYMVMICVVAMATVTSWSVNAVQDSAEPRAVTDNTRRVLDLLQGGHLTFDQAAHLIQVIDPLGQRAYRPASSPPPPNRKA